MHRTTYPSVAFTSVSHTTMPSNAPVPFHPLVKRRSGFDRRATDARVTVQQRICETASFPWWWDPGSFHLSPADTAWLAPVMSSTRERFWTAPGAAVATGNLQRGKQGRNKWTRTTTVMRRNTIQKVIAAKNRSLECNSTVRYIDTSRKISCDLYTDEISFTNRTQLRY